jgi:hypothetical protein
MRAAGYGRAFGRSCVRGCEPDGGVERDQRGPCRGRVAEDRVQQAARIARVLRDTPSVAGSFCSHAVISSLVSEYSFRSPQ